MSWISLTRCNQEKMPKLTEGKNNFVRLVAVTMQKKLHNHWIQLQPGPAPQGETLVPGTEVEETMYELQDPLSEGI